MESGKGVRGLSLNLFFYLTVIPFPRLIVFVVFGSSFGSLSCMFAFVPRIGFLLNQVSLVNEPFDVTLILPVRPTVP